MSKKRFTTDEVMSDEKLAAQVLREALDYLEWFRKRYAALRALAQVHRAIDGVVKKRKKK